MIKADLIIKEAKKYHNHEKTAILERFFKTGPGQYGAGDVFWGLSVPQSRIIAKKYKDLSLVEVKKLLASPVHEIRLIGLLILVEQFINGDVIKQRIVSHFYLKNTKYINNWDLVDVTCPRIVGEHLLDKDRSILYTFAKSKDLWKKRIAILATFTFIREKQFEDTLNISKILLKDEHDLIHKAVGWMLREVGNKNQKVEEEFLKKHYLKMSRTMLRYAIEKFEEKKRQSYLKGNV